MNGVAPEADTSPEGSGTSEVVRGASALTDPATGGDMVETLGTGSFIGVELVSATFDAGSEVGFDWLGQPLNSADTTLAAAGTVTLSDGHQITVTISTGHIAYVAP